MDADERTEGVLRVIANPAYRNRKGNPYNALLAEAVIGAGGVVDEFTMRRLASGRYDIWHLHWPDHALRHQTAWAASVGLARVVARLMVARLTRTRVVWTVHNVEPHSDLRYPFLYKVLRWALVRSVNAWISLSDEAHGEVVKAMPRLGNVRSAVIPHGHYRSSYPPPMPLTQARRALGVSTAGSAVLFFGLIREYKNVPALLRTFRTMAHTDLQLIVAGRPSDALAHELRSLAEEDPRVHLHLRFIPNEDLPAYFGAADLAVLPFSSSLNSGSALLALSMDTPILVKHEGSMRALERQIGKPWVTTYTGELTSDDLSSALASSATARGAAPLEPFEWQAIGAATVDLYRATLPGRLRRRASRPSLRS